MKLLYLLPILLVVGCVTDSAPISGLVAAVQDPEPVQVSIGVNDGSSLKIDMIAALPGTTALEAFEQVADVKTREFNYAKYVIAIDGVPERPQDSLAWAFYVNNEFSAIGPTDYTISGPVNLEFRLEPEHS